MITRREFTKLASAAGLAALGSAFVTGCGEARGAASASSASSASSSAESSSSSTSQSSSSAATSSSSSAAASSSSSASTASEASSQSSNPVVVYFSHTGENYSVGYISEGNTAIVANMIAEKTGAPTFEIVPATAYPEGYDDCCDVALEEKNSGARPAYSGDLANFDSYDTVYLGYPIWWGDLPMTVYTFIESHDWAGKTVYPFSTHAGSGLAGTEASLRSACAGATVESGFTIAGETAQNARTETESAVDEWLDA